MPITNPKSWYQFTLQHIAAESFFENVDLNSALQIEAILQNGNNDVRNLSVAGLVAQGKPPGFLRLTQRQAREFTSRYTVVHQTPNDASGFSATLLFDREAQQYTLAFRSLEYRDGVKGGDYDRDANGAAFEINNYGFALGQVASMEKYWTSLAGLATGGESAELLAFKQYMAGAGAQVNLTGYSLGAHLASVFTKIHPELVREAVVFNAAGIGPVPALGTDIAAMVSAWQAKLAAAGLNNLPTSENLYTRAGYQQALGEIVAQYSLQGAGTSPGSVDAELAGKVVHVFGHATHDDSEHVANSGRHGLSYPVFIEDQPD